MAMLRTKGFLIYALFSCLAAVFFSCASTPTATQDPVLPPYEEDSPAEPVQDEEPQPESENAGLAEVLPVEPPPLVWETPATVDSLSGTWIAMDGTGYVYPFDVDGRRYLLYHGAWKEVSEEWQKIAAAQGIDMEHLWQKRYAIVYTFKEHVLPYADENGSQMGIKFMRTAGHIYVRTDILVTELVFARNLPYFKLASDGRQFYEDGVFHLFSSSFPDIPQGKQTYQKK